MLLYNITDTSDETATGTARRLWLALILRLPKEYAAAMASSGGTQNGMRLPRLSAGDPNAGTVLSAGPSHVWDNVYTQKVSLDVVGLPLGTDPRAVRGKHCAQRRHTTREPCV